MIESETHPVEVEKLKKDLRQAAATLGIAEVRYLVDAYYQMQDDRIRAAHQARTLNASGEPHAIITWLGSQSDTLENEVKKVLDVYSMSRIEGRWARSHVGVGPVITAGLLAHIDITRARTAGNIWSFAGLDPTKKWEKGQKRPWNARLKVLCWKLGESFKKFSNHEECIYGRIYRERKALEVERNVAGQFSEQAAASLESKRIQDKELRATYEAGRLPAGRLDLRAMRYAVKLFLAHLHQVLYETHYGEPPVKPYILTQEPHSHFIAPPNWPMA